MNTFYKTINSNKLLDRKKVISMRSASSKINEYKKRGVKVVYTSGAFDLLHLGHLLYLKAAKAAGDILVVGLESDSSVANTRGEGRPFNKMKVRLEALAVLDFVDYAFPITDIIFSYKTARDTFIKRYRYLKPEMVAIPVWEVDTTEHMQQLKETGCKCVVIDIIVRAQDGSKLSNTGLSAKARR